MLLFQASSGGGPEQYAINNVVSRGPPIPEAGFSVSPLDAAYLNSSETSVVSQQNFAFVGGQTSTAFINMSQVALFSLPEQTWSFLPVSDPDSSATSNPSRRASATLDPRSGHAAAISDDGRRIWIVGGWVGDVSTPADPQLLVLEVGGSYGGTGNWQWTIPSQETGGPAGLYGHAAVMLPGDILMITGGYDISNVNSKLLRRRTGPPASTNTYFYNTSSNMWISNYQNPNANSNTSSGSFSPSDQTSGKTIGLGVGLGLGLPFLIVGLLYVLYRRRLRKRRQRRDRALQIPINPPAYQSRIPGSGGIDRQNDIPDQQAMQERSTANPYPWAPAPATAGSLGVGRGSEAERTGLLYDIPSPTRGLRRSLHSRSNNHWYEDGRRSRGSGHIHPINEEDEGDPSSGGRNARSGQTLIPLSDDIVSAAPVLDPFQDSRDRHLLDGSRSPSPVSPAQEREQEFQGWMNDWTVAQYRRQQQAGRTSPDKSDRTSSSLSDSARSAISALSYQPSVKRSSSQRSAALLSANVLPSPQRISPPESPQSPTAPAQYRRSHSLTLGQRSRIEESEPSGPSFPRLQAEGQALLGRAPPQPDSPTRTESRARTWMGSVRRALTGSQRNSIVTPEGRSSLGSEPGMLQRSASAGSMPWRRRQGARDWDYDDPSPEPGPTSTHGPDEDDWDVESAVERRVVQVMFTVPKDRLRVVNAGPGGDGASIASVEQDPLIDASQEKNKAKAKDEHEGQGVD
ncbi:MAG: hypothetical protein LQ340_004109 [Diploschistes diacapsis]|nr:MAG: hypothetical protein LQ340_004109 [Diploschistes diacapsis]